MGAEYFLFEDSSGQVPFIVSYRFAIITKFVIIASVVAG